jgi:hypothetical protein
LNGQHAVNELSDAPQLRPTCLGSGIDVRPWEAKAQFQKSPDEWN